MTKHLSTSNVFYKYYALLKNGLQKTSELYLDVLTEGELFTLSSMESIQQNLLEDAWTSDQIWVKTIYSRTHQLQMQGATLLFPCSLCILTYAKFENNQCLHLPSRKAPKIVSVVWVASGNSTTIALVVLNNPEEF